MLSPCTFASSLPRTPCSRLPAEPQAIPCQASCSARRPEAATDVLAERSVFVLDGQDLQEFDRTLSRPPADVPGLDELLSAPTVRTGQLRTPIGSGRPVTTRFRPVVPLAPPTWLLASLADRLISPNGSFTMGYRGISLAPPVFTWWPRIIPTTSARSATTRSVAPARRRSAWRLAVTTSPW